MCHVIVRVVDGDGTPVHDARITLYVHQRPASLKIPDGNTDGVGEAAFALDVGSWTEVSVFVNGQERVGRQALQAQYTVVI